MRKMMFRALGGALCLSMAALAASAASATAYTFNFQDKSAFTSTPDTFSAGTGGSALSVKMTAYHAFDFSSNVTTDLVGSASLNWYAGYGMGVVGYGDSTSNNTHQIDNVGSGWAGGTDFVVLQFSKAVSLSSIGQYVFPISGVSCCDSDASIFADTTGAGLQGITQNGVVNEASFTTLAGGNSAGLRSLAVSNSPSSSVWMIGAAFNQSNDGFKLANLVVNTPTAAAVPEPASWAMMIVGFGAVGGSLRARKRSVAFAA